MDGTRHEKKESISPLPHGVDPVEIEIVNIGGRAEDQVLGPELLEQSRTEPKGLGVMEKSI